MRPSKPDYSDPLKQACCRPQEGGHERRLKMPTCLLAKEEERSMKMYVDESPEDNKMGLQ